LILVLRPGVSLSPEKGSTGRGASVWSELTSSRIEQRDYVMHPFAWFFIADVGAATVPLIAAAGALAEPLDLSLAVTREVSTVHIAPAQHGRRGVCLDFDHRGGSAMGMGP
jgi:hypothetical protein